MTTASPIARSAPADRRLGRPPPLAHRVYDALLDDITAGRLKAGDRLPVEPALAESFGVSRTVIREAVSRLKADGLVRSRQGAGVFVSQARSQRAFRIAEPEGSGARLVREIFELRLGLEVEAATLAARRRSAEDLKALHAAVVAMEATKLGADDGVAADVDFHRRIALAAANAQFADLLRYLQVFLRQSISIARANTRRQPHLIDAVMEEHRAVLRAIEAGDAEAAGAAMRDHLLRAQRRLGLGD